MPSLSIKKAKAEKLEKAIDEARLFERASYSASAAENAGYSNYSYWRSTLQVFLKNRVAVCLLIVLAVIVTFTFVQPYLPGQYGATVINNNPQTGMQLSNLSPSLSTTHVVAEAGVTLMAEESGADGWYAVTNVIGSIKKRTEFTVTEYLGDWCAVEAGDLAGYVKNDFSTKLKLPENPEATPYACMSNFVVYVYTDMADYTNAGTNLYARSEDVDFDAAAGTAVTREKARLCVIPSTKAFIFGTNNIGQDLWARVWSGTRTSLFIGFVVALTEALLGILMGVLWGYVRGLDRILTEVYNVIDNIPTTIVLILVSYILRPSISTLILAMCLTGWLGMARFIRNQIVIIRDRDYNLASRCLGSGTMRIILRNLLPYLVSVIMLRMALAIPGAIGSEVFITYIGLGLPVDTPSLGNLINEGRKLIATSSLRYQLVFPALVLSVVTISFYIIGNAFADAADPKNHV